MEKYVILGRIGEGAHGIVFKAKSIETGALVALKKVALRRLEDGIPNTALREIKALQEIAESPFIVHLREVIGGLILIYTLVIYSTPFNLSIPLIPNSRFPPYIPHFLLVQCRLPLSIHSRQPNFRYVNVLNGKLPSS